MPFSIDWLRDAQFWPMSHEKSILEGFLEKGFPIL